MLDCSKTKIFLDELDRMCKYYSIPQNNEGEERCKKCPISIANNGKDVSCTNFPTRHPQEVIEIVQKWSDSNPVKTRQSELLKLFPETYLINGVINICPKDISRSIICVNPEISCDDCKKEYWLAEVK